MTEQTPHQDANRDANRDANQDTEHTQPIPTATSTHRYDAGPFGFPAQPTPPPQPSRPRGAVTAGVLVAALVVGGLAGVAGAAGFTAFDQLGDQPTSTATTPVTSASVSDREDTPAPEGSVEDVANSVLPSVVKINVTGGQGQGSGSGVVLSSDGEILTNNHVVEVAAQGGTISVSFDDGTAARASVVGTDPLTDLAVIKAEGVSGLTPATLGEAQNLDVGEEVIAIGSPFGLEATVTSGIVSALNRPVSVGESSSSSLDTTYPAIQTDAAINPGNSGGPLVNMQGEVVGINSSIRSSSSMGEGGSIGLGFAIPLDKVLPIVDQLRAGDTPTHARLGVTVSDAATDSGLLTGAGIGEVGSGTAADEAGLQAGDVVTKVDDQPVSGSESLVATIRGYRPGDTVTLTVVRDGETRTVRVTLDSDEGSASS
jgi:putative serine protease PepD